MSKTGRQNKRRDGRKSSKRRRGQKGHEGHDSGRERMPQMRDLDLIDEWGPTS